jgi:hypothetical protein
VLRDVRREARDVLAAVVAAAAAVEVHVAADFNGWS